MYKKLFVHTGLKQGHYLVDGTKLTLKSGSSQAIYDFELGQNQLTLSGDDLNQPLKFTKLLGIGRSTLPRSL
jgi:hypothetical protein